VGDDGFQQLPPETHSTEVLVYENREFSIMAFPADHSMAGKLPVDNDHQVLASRADSRQPILGTVQGRQSEKTRFGSKA